MTNIPERTSASSLIFSFSLGTYISETYTISRVGWVSNQSIESPSKRRSDQIFFTVI